MDANLYPKKFLLIAFLLGLALGLVTGDKFAPACKGCTFTHPDGSTTFGDCVGVAGIRDMYNGRSPDGDYSYIMLENPNITPSSTTTTTTTTTLTTTITTSTTTTTVVGWHVYPQELREAWNLKASDSAACYQVAYSAGVRACLHTLKLPATKRELND